MNDEKEKFNRRFNRLNLRLIKREII